ncbi:MAG: pro-sigmaK processing inhibitor BofA family protein [Clostridiales Family XIII bacterium]|nr:pro-sigmaK processing inhibitor BofA family protein [Clostridia bacterium]MDE8731954.1 pro-sigmaK processing inhibitor BofA family protein [Eubacteriales bacterium DFI.9.88]MDY3013197.1 pro-sigmaK processing inhibitor BofA family protein [Clostridiales Family XIII bacterium]
MSFGLEAGIFVAYAACLFLIYVLGKLLIVPLKWAGRMLINSMIGGVLIVLINMLGGNWGLFVPLNPLSAVIIGILGLPGAVGLLLFFNL